MAQNGVIFALKGNSVDAVVSSGGKTSTYGGTLPVACVADGNAIGGTAISLLGPATRSLSFPGLLNTPENSQWSTNIRVTFGYTGAPAATRGLWQMSGGQGTGFGYMVGLWHDTSARLRAFMRNNNGQVIASVNFATLIPTFGTYYDILTTMGGTTAANSFKVYVDTVASQATPGTSSPIDMIQNYREISIGGGPLAPNTDIKVNEFTLWGGTLINPSLVSLEGGVGALNGAARTSLVAVTPFDGSIYTNLNPTLALTTGSWVYAGVTFSGQYLSPGASSVINTVSFGASAGTTGTIVLPTTAQVENNVTFGPSGTLTGTLQAGGGSTTVASSVAFLGFGNIKLGG
jgi:hypothetical protein